MNAVDINSLVELMNSGKSYFFIITQVTQSEQNVCRMILTKQKICT